MIDQSTLSEEIIVPFKLYEVDDSNYNVFKLELCRFQVVRVVSCEGFEVGF